MAGWSQNGTGWDLDERVQKVALLCWDTDSLSWVRQGTIAGGTGGSPTASVKQSLFDQTSPTTLYIGKAAQAAAVTDPAWLVTRVVFDGTGFPASITHSGSGTATDRWDQRAALSYS